MHLLKAPKEYFSVCIIERFHDIKYGVGEILTVITRSENISVLLKFNLKNCLKLVPMWILFLQKLRVHKRFVLFSKQVTNNILYYILQKLNHLINLFFKIISQKNTF